MSSPAVSCRVRIATVAGLTALAGAAGVAAAAGEPQTTIAVAPRVLLLRPDRSPVDFPGVARARAGEPLPRGYAAIGRGVRIERGRELAHGALRMVCPRGKAWRSGAADGALVLSVLDRVVSGKRSVLVMAGVDTRTTSRGETASGTIYALCR